jgi:hypothetical protein
MAVYVNVRKDRRSRGVKITAEDETWIDPVFAHRWKVHSQPSVSSSDCDTAIAELFGSGARARNKVGYGLRCRWCRGA